MLPTIMDLNCKADSTNINVEKFQKKKRKMYHFSADGTFSTDKELDCNKR